MNVELMSTVLNWTSRPEDVEALSCEHCNEVMKNPQRLPCGHSFCNPCVPNLKKKCGVCGRDFKKEHVSKDMLAFNLIEELILKCDHGACLWSGQFVDYRIHLKKLHLKSPAKEDLIKALGEDEKVKRVLSNPLPESQEITGDTNQEILQTDEPVRSFEITNLTRCKLI